MYKIPILFLEDDETLIQMYSQFLDDKGYRSILIRNGQKGILEAMTDGPALLTLKASDATAHVENKVPVLIITDAHKPIYKKRYEIMQAVESSEIFRKLKNTFQNFE